MGVAISSRTSSSGRVGASFSHLPKPQLEAYLGSVTGRRGTSQKDPYHRVLKQEEGPHKTRIGRSVTPLFCQCEIISSGVFMRYITRLVLMGTLTVLLSSTVFAQAIAGAGIHPG